MAAFVRLSECVPYPDFRNPIAVTHSSTSRAYWRVLMWPVWSTRLGNRKSPVDPPRRCTNIGSQLELDGAVGLLLNDYGSIANISTSNDIPDLNLDQVAAAQLAIDS